LPAELIVCSHRGPFVYEPRSEGLVPKRGGGGLIGAVAPVLAELGGTWIAAALSDEDREMARGAPQGREEQHFRLRMLDLPPDMHTAHYDEISNEYLWFLFHYLFDTPYQPAFGGEFSRAWDDYRRVNERYADAVADSGRADAVFVHDYHLMLVGAILRTKSRARRPLMYFHHTPWCDPEYFSMLRDDVGAEILRGMLAYDVVGFHSRRWADNFRACCARLLPGAKASASRVTFGRRETRVIVAPVPLDTDHLDRELADPRTVGWAKKHDEMRAGRKMLLRVDRVDLSKNPLRGFLAFEALLERRPQLAREMVFLALLYPSRLNVEAYRRYYKQCVAVARRCNERFASKTGTGKGPIQLHLKDDYHRSLGAMRTYDALLVNPVFDGLNLVAKEGAYANGRAGSLILSRNAGVCEEMGDDAIAINPFDVGSTADAIDEALSQSVAHRQPSAERLRAAAAGSSPRRWVGAHLRAAGISI
jgi:trehalose 6-phosphate synthase